MFKISLRPSNLIFIIIFIAIAFLTTSLIRSVQYKNFHGQGAHSFMINLQAIEISQKRKLNLNDSEVELAGDYIQIHGDWHHPYTPLPSLVGALSHQIFYEATVKNLLSESYMMNLLASSIALNLMQYILVFAAGIYLFRILRHLNIDTKYAGLILWSYLFASIITTYSYNNYHHALGSAFFIIGIYYLIKKNQLLFGLFLGLAFVSEYVYGIFLALYAITEVIKLVRDQDFKSFLSKNMQAIFGFVPALLIFLAHNYLLTGNMFLLAEMLYKDTSLLDRFSFKLLSQNILSYFISPLRGILYLLPYSILAISYLIYKRKVLLNKFPFLKSQSFFLITCFTIVSILFYSSWEDCLGATIISNRYAISIIPFILISLGIILQHCEKSFRNIIYIFLFLGFVINTHLSLINPNLNYFPGEMSGQCVHQISNIKNLPLGTMDHGKIAIEFKSAIPVINQFNNEQLSRTFGTYVYSIGIIAFLLILNMREADKLESKKQGDTKGF